MRAFDAVAIEDCAVPGVLLMENAGRGATDILERELLGGSASGKRVTVVCGTGNNGGDGFVIARHLLLRGAVPEVVLVGDRSRVSGDARVNLAALEGVGVAIGGEESLRGALENARVVVDALFGTGLDRPLADSHTAVVEAMNGASAARFSVDLPSGLDANTGACLGAAVEATVTATFAHYKLGLLTPGGARLAGRVFVTDIGVPAMLHTRVGHTAHLFERSDAVRNLPPRVRSAHKNTSGHVAVFAGSAGKAGAALLVAQGALRAGAGLVTLATWPETARVIEGRLLEVMVSALDETALAPSTSRVLEGKRAVVVGPGFGMDGRARSVLECLIASAAVPVVVDADGLSIFAGCPSVFGAGRTILTPHPAEAARLLGTTTERVEANRFEAVSTLARRARAVVVLKGAHSLVGGPDGEIVVSPIAEPALATAGSGDTLAGIVGAFVCGLAPFDAACLAVYVHGLAGQRCAKDRGDRGVVASDLADRVPEVMRTLIEAGA
jgi:NAD(P)H-hydrate epimerase